MICVIPARAGSKRLPGKNVKKLFGTPVIEHVVNICYESRLFDDICVSTDSMEIANTCSSEYDIRPERLRGDVSETDVIIDFMERYRIDEICRVYPFAALLTQKRLLNGIALFEYGGGTVMERTKYKHPIQRAIKDNGEYNDFSSVMQRTQDLPDMYHDAATFMITTIDELKKPLYHRDIRWIDVSGLECQDVDDVEDWEMLKMKFVRLHT